ncbi:MAG: methyltransferase domain-containing protein [Gemmatimonadaceae bacterium]
MAGLFTPRRRRGIELLDDPHIDPAIITRSMCDVSRSNRLFGGTRAAIDELRPAMSSLCSHATLLDVGTGCGDIPMRARHTAAKAGVSLWTIGVDIAEPLLSTHRDRNSVVLRGDAMKLPFRDRSVDIVMCSQLLHHFAADNAVALIREMNRVAKMRVVVSDIRRSWVAAGGIWLTSFALGFHRVSRHDGVVSVMRGFVRCELADIVESAVGSRPRVRRRPGFRLTTSWTPR